MFQNRYKSILCQEDTYLLELTRYIHLNPLRAKIVKTLTDSDKYPYSGHSALMGKIKREFLSDQINLLKIKEINVKQGVV